MQAKKAVYFPASFSQQGLWLINQLDPGKATYNISSGLQIRGILDPQVLRRTLAEIVRRHESLRTYFIAVCGEPKQVIEDHGEIHLSFVDLSLQTETDDVEAEARKLAEKEARQPFDLGKAPLLRAKLLRIGAQDHVLLFTMHHIISDAWSITVLAQEVSVLYGAFSAGRPSPLPELPIQYADYSLWQRDQMESGVLEQQLSYWKQQLAGVSTLELPTDRPRPTHQSQNGSTIPLAISADLTKRLKKLGKTQGASLFMVLLAVFYTLLYRDSGQEDIAVGSPIAGRPNADTQGLIGFFINTLVLRADLSGGPSFVELLRRVREITLKAYEHQDVPFRQLVEELAPERELSHTPLFQVMITLQNVPQLELKLGSANVELFNIDTRTAKFDLLLNLSEDSAGDLQSSLEYDADLFDGRSITRMISRYRMLLEGVVARPEQSIDLLPLLSATDRHQILVEWNRTSQEYPVITLPQLLEEQACRTPDDIAVIYDGQRLNYSELHQRANQLGHYLQKLGVGPDARVAVCLERGLEMVVGLLGILKTGGAYIPVDPSYPKERVRYMLEDAEVHVLITQSNVLALLPDFDGPVVRIDDQWEEIAKESAQNVKSETQPENLAYIIYTSGSTGKPKGVQISHSALVNFLWSMRSWPGIEPRDCVLAETSLSFDIAGVEIYLPLIVGAQVKLLSSEAAKDSAQLLQGVKDGVTIMQATPATWSLLLESEWQGSPGLKAFCGGEALHSDLAKKLIDRCDSLWNLYGPTETTIWSLGERIEDNGVPISIGRPIGNTQAYVLSRELQPAPIGIPGELYLGGAGLARGYLRRPELTAERFVPNPFSAEGGEQLYRTGDRVRWRGDGKIEFLGRLDEQIKLRGYRIELGEIEAALREQAGIEKAVVVLREDLPGQKQLVGYVVGSIPKEGGQADLNLGRLKNGLRQRLPEYMVPGLLMSLPTLPLTPNGKLDRKCLPAPETGVGARGAAYVAPRTPIEEILCSLWAEVLRIKEVGVQDNFFELGGQSLLAAQVTARIKKIFHIDVPLRRLFETPTIADIAKVIEDPLQIASKQNLPPIVPMLRRDVAPLSYGQQRLWFLYQTAPDDPSYNVPFAIRIQGPIEIDVLHRSLQEVMRRQESLRTRFVVERGVLTQVVDDNFEVELLVVHLSSTPEVQREEELKKLAALEARKPFDLARGPVLRAKLLRLGEQHHALLVTMHHIVTDAWSAGVFAREIFILYEAFKAGRPSPLPELPIQYIDFSVWQRSWLQGDALEEQLNYWRKQLANLEKLRLPFDHPNPAVPSYRGGNLPVRWDAELTAEVSQLGSKHGATLYMTVLAAFQTLLYRYTGQHDIPVGSVSAGRTQAETESLIGFFVNTLVMRSRISQASSFSELLRQVKKTTLDAYAHQDVPFQMLVQELLGQRDLSRSQLFQVTFNMQNVPQPILQESPTKIQPLDFQLDTVRFDLSLTLEKSGDCITGYLSYNIDLFDAVTVTGMLRRLEILLRGIVSNPDRRLSEFPILDEAEHNVLTAGMVAARDVQTGAFSLDPLAGSMRLFVLDEEFNPVPDDVVGEVCIAEEMFIADDHDEPGVSFIPNPFAGIPGARMYRTGDFARRRSNGILEYCDRRDAQTLGGEIDDASAVAPDRSAKESSPYEAPRNHIEELLAHIWEQTLDISRVGVHDDFFNLGGHSMLATLVVAQISDEFHVDIPVRQFFAAPTVAQLAKVITQDDDDTTNEDPSRILVAIQPLGSGTPFFCVHPVAGDVLCYVDLSREIGTVQPFYGLQAPAPDSALAPLDSIEKMAALYKQEIQRVQPHGPYLIGGWSMGGIVAFEMARQLRQASEEIALLVLMDASLPEPYRHRTDNTESHTILTLFALNMSYQVGKDPRELQQQFMQLREQEQRKMIFDILMQERLLPRDASRAEKKFQNQLNVYARNMHAFATYPLQRTEQKIVFCEAAESGRDWSLAEDWRPWTGEIESYVIPGSHHSMFKRPHVSILGQHIRRCIAVARDIAGSPFSAASNGSFQKHESV